jgi:N-acetylmuramoyl-L-alanine amidase
MGGVGKIILDGKEVEVGAPVLTYRDHGMTFVGKKNTLKRELRPDVIIWHWTGGENSAETVYHTLINRNLGVTFCIDRNGVIYQFLDPILYDPKDTEGKVGRRSISLEIANYGFRMKGQPIPTRGKDRILDDEVIHRTKVRCARFLPDQITSVAALTKVLCAELGIPLAFPREPSGEIALRVLTPKEQRAFKGVMGHFHKTTEKFDPGFHIFRELGHLEAA